MKAAYFLVLRVQRDEATQLRRDELGLELKLLDHPNDAELAKEGIRLKAARFVHEQRSDLVHQLFWSSTQSLVAQDLIEVECNLVLGPNWEIGMKSAGQGGGAVFGEDMMGGGALPVAILRRRRGS